MSLKTTASDAKQSDSNAVNHSRTRLAQKNIPLASHSQSLVHTSIKPLIQSKLKIGAPNDKYEQEADRVADQVMRMPEPRFSPAANEPPPSNDNGGGGLIQRTCVSCARDYQAAEQEERPVISGNLCPKCRVQRKPLLETMTPIVQRQESEEEAEEELLQTKPLIQRQTDEEEEEEGMIQAKADAGQTPQLSPEASSQILGLRGGGQALDASTRAYMEPRFGHDFSRVRIHTDNRAADLAREINARAFTLSNDVVFGAGQYSSGSYSGRRLLAHELTHVVQQNRGLNPSPVARTSHEGGLAQTKMPRPVVSTATPPTIHRKFKGTDGQKVEMTKKAGRIVITSKNAPFDLKELIRLVNASGSTTAIGLIIKAGNNESMINVRIEEKPVPNKLYGLHQAHDKSGKPLKWDSTKGDFVGVPEYVGGKSGTRGYKEATVTIFKGNLEKGGGNVSSHTSAGLTLTLEQLVAGTFAHEVGHNVDEEFIEDLRKRREGKTNKGLDAHTNISPIDQKVYGEIGAHERKIRKIIKPCMADKKNLLPGGVGLITHMMRESQLVTVLGNEQDFLEEQIRRNDKARRFVCEAGVPAMIALYDTRNSGVLLEVECARRALAFHRKHYLYDALKKRRHELLRPFFTPRQYWLPLYKADKGKAKWGNLEPLIPVRALTDASVNGRQLVRVMAGDLQCQEGYITVTTKQVEPKATSLPDPKRLALVFMENPLRFGSTFLETGVGQAKQATRLRVYVPPDKNKDKDGKKAKPKYRKIKKGRVFVVRKSGHSDKEYRINIRLGNTRVEGFIDKRHVQHDRKKRQQERNYFINVGRRIATGRKTVFVDPNTQKCSNDRLAIEFNSAQGIVRGIVGAANCTKGLVDEVHIVGHGGTHGMPGVGDYKQMFGLYLNRYESTLAKKPEAGAMTADQFSEAVKTALADGVRFWIHACSTADNHKRPDPNDLNKKIEVPGFAEELATSLRKKGGRNKAEVAALPGIGPAEKGITHKYKFKVYPRSKAGAKPKEEFFPQKL